MRYFTYISIIIIGLSAGFAYLVFYNPSAVSSPAVIINKRTVSTEDVASVVEGRPSYQAPQEALDQLISRELLIQEAMARGLDNDPRFLKRVRDFYEKNLIQGLLEDQMENISHEQLDNATIARYSELMDGSVKIEKQVYPDQHAVERKAPESVEVEMVPFSDLSSVMRYKIAEAGPGEQFIVRKGSKRIAYEVLSFESNKEGTAENKADIEKMIAEEKRRAMLDEWIADLREKADVKIIETYFGE